jgi:hypothetical protein
MKTGSNQLCADHVVLRFLAAALLAVLVACGGGGGAVGYVEAPQVRAGVADIGPAGGIVDAVLEGGATVALTVPPGALATRTTLRIVPEAGASADTLGIFTISPAGLTLLKPVTLTMVLPVGVQAVPDAGLALLTANGVVPIGGTVDAATRRVNAQLSFLPAAGSTTARALAAATPARLAATAVEENVRVMLRNIGGTAGGRSFRAQTLVILVAALQQQGSINIAMLVQMAADSLTPGTTAENSILAAMLDWRNVVCPQQNFAVSALNTFNGADVVTFQTRAFDAAVWTLLARDMDATVRRAFNATVPLCSGLPVNFLQPVVDKLPGFTAAVTQSLSLLDPRTEFEQLLTARLPELIELEVSLQLFGLETSALNLLSDQLDRLRTAGYENCRIGQTQLLQKRLLAFEVGNANYNAASRYSEADLQQDIQFCGMPLRWQLKNENGQFVSEGVAGGVGVGQTRTAVNLPLTGVSQLVLTGPLSALRCPAGSQNNEQLSFSAGPVAGGLTPVGLLSSSNENGYLQVSTLDINVAQLRALALPAGGLGSGRLVVNRLGGTCHDEFANLNTHDVIVTFSLDFDNVLITTTGLPDGAVSSRYQATPAVDGGQAPYTWHASGLPPGLVQDVNTGAISGVATAAGNFAVVIQVRSADGLTASKSLTLHVSALPASWLGTLVLTSVTNGGGANPNPQPGSSQSFSIQSNATATVAVRIDNLGLGATGRLVILGTSNLGGSFGETLSQSSDDPCFTTRDVTLVPFFDQLSVLQGSDGLTVALAVDGTYHLPHLFFAIGGAGVNETTVTACGAGSSVSTIQVGRGEEIQFLGLLAGSLVAGQIVGTVTEVSTRELHWVGGPQTQTVTITWNLHPL